MTIGPMTIHDLRRAYRDGTLTVAEVLESVWARLDAHADPAMLIGGPLRTEATAAAARLATRNPRDLPLYGIPFVAKDNIDAAGVDTTAGCPGFAYRARHSATVIERLEAAGAILVGKTNLDQFATGLVGTRSPYGTPRNPLDAERIPGGSSSGSAVAVAAGIVPLALGTDTAGSGRVPAAACNIVGCKPTRGRLSVRGVVPAVQSLDCVSIFTTSCADAGLVLATIDAFDPNDPWSRARPEQAVAPLRRVAVPRPDLRDFDGSASDQWAFETALTELVAVGCELVPIDDTPLREAAQLLYGGPWVAERTAAVGHAIAAGVEGLDPTVAGIIASGAHHSAVDAYRAGYRLAELRRRVDAIWKDVDGLVVPTAPRIPSLAEVAADPVGVNSRLGTYTNCCNLLDCCALALPAPRQRGAAPAGFTLMAPAWNDEALLALGERLHPRCAAACGATAMPVPTARRDPPPLPGWHELLVVGAHLRGQPLEHQLTALGGRFIAEARTATEYRLYALPGETPKPGLVHVGGGGASIAGERWALPATMMGDFLAAIPAPLGLGKVQLMNGSQVTGFLCSAAAIAGCEDITSHGGWRAWLAASHVSR